MELHAVGPQTTGERGGGLLWDKESGHGSKHYKGIEFHTNCPLLLAGNHNNP